MRFDTINLIYFSATGTTAKIVSAIGEGTGIAETKNYKIIHSPSTIISIPKNELAVFGVPVFSGRVPQIAKESLGRIKGNNTPAILTCVYGNREFDDALLELSDIVVANGFMPISAGAFVAQHSIFPKVGEGRPDSNDLQLAKVFGAHSVEFLSIEFTSELSVAGNFPYRDINKIPLMPRTNRKLCNQCGLCAKNCPTQAIDGYHPHRVDKERCIACAHCISICPQKAKAFGGLVYALAKSSFEKKNRDRKESYILYR